MKRSAIYAGSFDPPTLGHVDIVRRGAELFDELLVAVGHNPKKNTFFTLDERVALMTESVADIPNARVISFSGLLVHLCEEQGANAILRGLRALSDFDIEFRYGLANRDLTGIETVFLLTEPQNIFVSSSLIKEIALNDGDISRYVPDCVLKEMHKRIAG